MNTGASGTSNRGRIKETIDALPAVQRPAVIEVREEALPRTAIRKLKRREIAAALAEQLRSEELARDGSARISADTGVARAIARVAGVEADRVHAALRMREDLAFDSLNNLTGVDYLETDAKLAAKFPYQPHLEVVYHLYSFSNKHRAVVKVKLPRWKNDQSGQIPELPTVSHVWGIADWHEREAYDLVGIHFVGHPNLVRILCPDDWEGHPLRKDYEFPLEYHGVRGQ